MRSVFYPAIAVLLATGFLSACTNDSDTGESVGDAISEAVTPSVDVEEELNSLLREVEDEYGGTVGLALHTSDADYAAGDKGLGPAWSTIKVPIAITALRDGASEDLVDMAIKESDNDAAYALWSQVQWTEGSANEAVEEFLAGHDSHVDMGDGPFGDAVWPLAEQAKFATDMPCMPEADYVYEALSDIVDWQHWGLNAHDDSRAKGGWGLDNPTQIYTHRQFGVIDTDEGQVGVALSITFDTTEDEPSFEWPVEETANDAVDALGQGLHELVHEAVDDSAIDPVHECSTR